MPKPFEEPSEVSAEAGKVVVEGPDNLAYEMTPEAAARTSARLLQGAARAKGQQSDGEIDSGESAGEPSH